jgi:hypothetical protein
MPTAPPFLEQAIPVLEHSIDNLSDLTGLSTLVVVIGLVLEFAPTLSAEIKHLFAKGPVNWKAISGALGAILVIGGVAGEFWFHHLSSTEETKLRSANNTLIERLKLSSETAKRDAQIARRDLASAQLEIEKAKSSAEAARRDTKIAQAAIAAANARAEEAKKAAEREQLERIRLEKSVTPRRLTASNKSRLIELLTRPPKAEVVVCSQLMDTESADLADDIVSVLKDSGWTASKNMGLITNQSGIGLCCTAPLELRPLKALGKAFAAIGIVYLETVPPSASHVGGGLKPGVIYVLIHHKQFGDWIKDR